MTPLGGRLHLLPPLLLLLACVVPPSCPMQESFNHLPPGQRRQVLDALESTLLGMFGMHSRPAPRRGPLHVPRRLRELYEQANGLQKGTLAAELQDRRRRARRPPGNTVRSFYFTESADRDTDPHQRHFHFDLSGVPGEERLRGAELYVLRHPNASHTASSHSNNSSSHSNGRVEVLQVMQPSAPSSPPISRLLDTRHHRHRHGEHEQWEALDVSAAVAQWLAAPATNHGLQVRADSAPTPHVRLRRSAGASEAEWRAQQPYLVTYTDDRHAPERSRTRRSKKKQRGGGKRRKKPRRQRKKLCQRHKLYVDFSDVGWNDWIVAPPGYDAYFCQGECPFYLPDNLNTTNHAVVQALVHSVNSQAVPTPCCVPTELSPMSMLYINNEEKVVLKTYRDMVVEACGCR